MTELIWDGKYKDGKKQGPVRIALPFQTIETVNESAQERQRSLELYSAGRETEWRNRLIWGDKKYVLPSLLPEFAGKVNLIYIDPPFDTGADFSFTASIPDYPEESDESKTVFTKEPSILEQKAYRDTWGRGMDSYLEWVYATVILLRELLAENGSIYVHCDSGVNSYIRAILDEVFGGQNFRNEITWKRRVGTSSSVHESNRFGICTDTIFFYAASDEAVLIPQYNRDAAEYQDYIAAKFTYKDEKGRRYRTDNLANPAPRPNLKYEYKGFKPPKNGWAISREKMEQWDREGRLYFPKNPDGRIMRKRYLDELKGMPVQNLWTDIAADKFTGRRATSATQPKSPKLFSSASLEASSMRATSCSIASQAAVRPPSSRRSSIGAGLRATSAALPFTLPASVCSAFQRASPSSSRTSASTNVRRGRSPSFLRTGKTI